MPRIDAGRFHVVASALVMLTTAAVGSTGEGARMPSEMLDLPEAEFFEALPALVNRPPESAESLWLLLDRCRLDAEKATPEEDEGVPASIHRMLACGELGQLLASLAAEDEQERVISTLESLPEGDWLRGSLLHGLIDGRLAQALRHPPVFPPTSDAVESHSPLPEFLESAAVELQEAFRLRDGLLSGYWSRIESAGQGADGADFLSHGADFERAVLDHLRGGATPETTIARLERFRWGGTCGTGSDRLIGPQARTLLLAYLEAGNPRLAAGAALASPGYRRGSPTTLGHDWERTLLAALGFDWEVAAVGGVLARRRAGSEVAALGRHASDRGARLLVAAAGVSRADDEAGRLGQQDEYLHAVAAFVRRGGGCLDYDVLSSLDVERAPDAPPVGADVEAAVLELLEGRVGPGAALADAETASHLLLRACREESRLTFRRMTRSRYARVRDAGVLALRSLGEVVKSRPAAPPVRLRVTVNGVPAAGLSVNQGFKRSIDRTWTEVALKTDGDGRVRLDRDPLLDPKEVVEAITLSSVVARGRLLRSARAELQRA